MRVATISAVGMLLLGSAGVALAAKDEVEVTPESIKTIEGLTVTTERRADGLIRVEVVHDPAKARWPGQDARLRVAGPSGTAVECLLAGEKTERGLRYRAWLAPDQADRAEIVVAEYQVATAGDRVEQILGGGTFYTIRLKPFVAPPPAKGEAAGRPGPAQAGL